MKKVRSLLMVSLLILTLTLMGCTGKPATADSDGSQAVDQGSEQKYELNFCYFGPAMIPPGQAAEGAAKMVEEKTNGRVKINTYYSESLLAYGDTLTGTASGVTDIAFVDGGLLSGQFDLNMIFTRFLPEAPPQEASTKVFRELIRTYPELNEELEAKGVRWLSIMSTPGEHLHGNKEVRVPDDVKGMKVACVGEPAVWFKSLGAAPIGVAAGDFYMSLERGLVDAQWMFWPVLEGFKLYEVTKYHNLFGENGSNLNLMGYIINLNTWNSLPKDIQDILVEAYDWAGDQIVKANGEEIGMAIENAKKRGNIFVELTSEELALWAETMEAVNQEWIKSTEAKGKPAQKLYEALMELLKKYNT
ncbi:MAG: TRAP transporter substrate-binding protein DctP [Peptococcaceae bacterium]|nr:TRAP transporter substrate-binding protein DctP [Peptococcaceae bacterium]